MPCHEDHHFVHKHTHGENCGHMAVRHDGHTDYLHDGHLHHPHEGHFDEHKLEIGGDMPERCTPDVTCNDHTHGAGCGHEAVPHGQHVDYVVNGRLHHPHDGHCDDHGKLPLV